MATSHEVLKQTKIIKIQNNKIFHILGKDMKYYRLITEMKDLPSVHEDDRFFISRQHAENCAKKI